MSFLVVVCDSLEEVVNTSVIGVLGFHRTMPVLILQTKEVIIMAVNIDITFIIH